MIELNYHVGWVLFRVSCDTTADVGQHDRYFRIGHAVNDLVVLSVGVTVHSQADDALEALHKRSVAYAELMLALVGRIV